MATKIVNIEHTRGDDFLRGFTLKGLWQANDFAAFAFTIRSKIPPTSVDDDEDDDVLVKLTLDETADGVISFEAPDSQQGFVRLNKAITTAFENDDDAYRYDFVSLTNSGIETTHLKGTIKFGWDATRAPLT